MGISDIPEVVPDRNVAKVIKANKRDVTFTKLEKNTLFKLDDDEEVYNYQVKLLEQIGLKDPLHYQKWFFKRSDISSDKFFWGNFLSDLDKRFKVKVKRTQHYTRRRTDVLPGFVGNLKDEKIKAELDSIFNGHAEQISTGNHTLSLSSYRAMIRTFKRLYKSGDNNSRAVILMALSTMRDCVISEQSDSWYLDSLLSLQDIIDSFADDGNDLIMPIPAPLRRVELLYDEHYEYDSLTDDEDES